MKSFPLRAALAPAILAGAAVALALLALGTATSPGPGEWLFTGMQNRWKWGTDWTPEFGPWGWLLFAPATAECGFRLWLVALAGGGATTAGFTAIFGRGGSGLTIGAALAVAAGVLLIPGSTLLLPSVLCGWGVFRTMREGREAAALGLAAALGTWAVLHRDAAFVALGSGVGGALAGWRTLRWRALIPLAFAGICLTGWWGAALQPLSGLGAWLVHATTVPDATLEPYRHAATLPALLGLLLLALTLALDRCRRDPLTATAMLATLALAVHASNTTYGNAGVAALLALGGTLAGLAASPFPSTRRAQLPVFGIAVLALLVWAGQWAAGPRWSLGRIATHALPLSPGLAKVVGDPWMQTLLQDSATATAEAWPVVRQLSSDPQPEVAPVRLVHWNLPDGRWGGAHEISTLRALGDTHAVGAEFDGGCVLLPNRHARPVAAAVALPITGHSGELIDLSAADGDRLWLRIRVRPTLLGRLAGALRRGLPLRIVATDAAGRTVAGLVTCAEAAGEFLVAPLVVNPGDLVRLGDGRDAGRRPVHLRIEVPGRARTWLQDGFDLEWRATTIAPTQAAYPDWVFLARGWSYPIPSDYTGRIAPVGVYSQHRFTMLPSGEVTLPLGANARRMHGFFGLQGWSGASDVRTRFTVTLRRDGRDQTLLDRTLTPLAQPSDRAGVPLSLDLVGRSGELVLRIESASPAARTDGIPFWQELTLDRFPPRVSTEPTRELVLAGAGFNQLPVSILAYTQAIPETVAGRKALFAHAPSEIVFHVAPSAHRVSGACGFTPGAYTPPAGLTDGAVFVVRWEPTGGVSRELWRMSLAPVTNVADRGLHDFDAEFDGASGGTLRLLVEPGAADNAQCDWTVWSGVQVD